MQKIHDMLDILKDLKENYGAIAVKSEFEAEGSRFGEVVRLLEVIYRADMDLIVKIGGCEAISDMDNCRLLGAKGVMAPMIETPFAAEKFINAVKAVFPPKELQKLEIIINAETKACFQNFDDILNDKNCELLNTIVIGRKDLTASYGLENSEIDSGLIYGVCEKMLEKTRAKGLVGAVGGGLSANSEKSITFLKNLDGLLDRFESRKIVFDAKKGLKTVEKGLKRAAEFECLYLNFLSEYYSQIASKNDKRIEKMQNYLNCR